MKAIPGTRMLAAGALLWLGCREGSTGPDGDISKNQIAFLAGGNVGSIREDGTNRLMLTNDDLGQFDGATGPLKWSPDGSRLVVHLIREEPAGHTDEAAVVAGDGTGYNV